MLQSAPDILDRGYGVYVADYRAATGRTSLWPRAVAKLVHRSRVVRACCSSCKVSTLQPTVSMRETKSECHPVDASCPNFKGRQRRRPQRRRCRRSCLLLGIRFHKHNILLPYHMANFYRISHREPEQTIRIIIEFGRVTPSTVIPLKTWGFSLSSLQAIPPPEDYVIFVMVYVDWKTSRSLGTS